MKILEILELVEENKNKVPVEKILKFEEAKIHLSKPQYKEEYINIFQEVIDNEN